MQVRRASSREAPRIVAILRENFPPDRLPLTIGGADGMESYVRDSLAHQDHADSTWHVLAADHAGVAGFAEIRRDPHTLFVNHVFLDASIRGLGFGTRLLGQSLAAARDAGQTRVALDVFHDNTDAQRWYRRLGFCHSQEFWWLETPLTAQPHGPGPSYFHGLAQAEIAQQHYQFSEFSLVTSQKTYRVGRLGNHLFRVTDPALLADSGAVHALATLDPNRRLLCIGPAEVLAARIPAGAGCRARVFRMTAQTDDLLRGASVSLSTLTFSLATAPAINQPSPR